MLGLVLVGYFMTIVGQTILESERRMRSKHQKRVTTALTKMAQEKFHSFDKFRSFFRSILVSSSSDHRDMQHTQISISVSPQPRY
jgi:hypothetical protein